MGPPCLHSNPSKIFAHEGKQVHIHVSNGFYIYVGEVYRWIFCTTSCFTHVAGSRARSQLFCWPFRLVSPFGSILSNPKWLSLSRKSNNLESQEGLIYKALVLLTKPCFHLVQFLSYNVTMCALHLTFLSTYK